MNTEMSLLGSIKQNRTISSNRNRKSYRIGINRALIQSLQNSPSATQITDQIEKWNSKLNKNKSDPFISSKVVRHVPCGRIHTRSPSRSPRMWSIGNRTPPAFWARIGVKIRDLRYRARPKP